MVKIARPVNVTQWVAHRLELAFLDAVKTCSHLNRFWDTIRSTFKLLLLPQTIHRGKRNSKHSRGRCCLWQWCTEHKVVGQQTQVYMCPREAQSSTSDEHARAASQRYSERPAVREICEVCQPRDGCNEGTINIQQGLSECWTMNHRHSYQPWDHSGTLRTIQTR